MNRWSRCHPGVGRGEMGTTSSNDSPSDVLRQLERLRSGEQAALGELFANHRDRLRRMVALRMDWRLQARVDASDVLQEAYLDAAARLDGYLREPKVPVFLWLRLIVGERLTNLHRHHLGTRMRDAGCEVSLQRGAMPAASSAALASMLLGRLTSPTQAAVRAERLSAAPGSAQHAGWLGPGGPGAPALRASESDRGGAGPGHQ